MWRPSSERNRLLSICLLLTSQYYVLDRVWHIYPHHYFTLHSTLYILLVLFNCICISAEAFIVPRTTSASVNFWSGCFSLKGFRMGNPLHETNIEFVIKHNRRSHLLIRINRPMGWIRSVRVVERKTADRPRERGMRQRNSRLRPSGTWRD